MRKIFLKKRKDNPGFTLIEMAVVMVVVGMIISIMMTVLPSVLKTGKIKEARAKLSKFDYALQGYAMANFRLPFADSNGNGSENTNVFSGSLPYLTLGLTNGNDVWGNRTKYAVYGRTGGANNLTDTTDAATFKTAVQGISGFSSTIVYITSADTCATANASNSANQAYVIASGGPKDLDGNNGFFDLCTGTAGVGFNEDTKIQALNYDDIVRAQDLNGLLLKVSGP